MGYINHVTTHETDPNLSGVQALEIVTINGVQKLYAGSEQTGGMSVFTLGTGAATYQEQIGYTSNRGTAGLCDIDFATIGATTILIPSGRYADRVAFHNIGANGGFESVTLLGASPELISSFQDSVTLEVEGKTFLISSQWNQSGFETFQIRNDLTLQPITSWVDTATTYVSDISALASATIAGRSYFFAASSLDAGVTCYWMGQWGNVKVRGSIGEAEGLGIRTPTCLDTATVDGKFYLLLGSSGSGTISVLRVNDWGGIFEVGTYMDNLNSRFGGIQEIETFQIGNRTFVVTGGGDDGISLFELQPGGSLFHLEWVSDKTFTTLMNVSAIAVESVDGTVQMFVSGSETGITQFTVDMSNIVDAKSGTDLADTITGSTGDDLIHGKDGDDILNGGAGNDRLIDGAGSDTMTGSSGDDVFVFVKDGRMDTIMDFVVSQDKIDLSALDMLYDVSQLTLTQKAYGVLVEYGNERIHIEGPGPGLLVSDFGNEQFYFGF